MNKEQYTALRDGIKGLTSDPKVMQQGLDLLDILEQGYTLAEQNNATIAELNEGMEQLRSVNMRLFQAQGTEAKENGPGFEDPANELEKVEEQTEAIKKSIMEDLGHASK